MTKTPENVSPKELYNQGRYVETLAACKRYLAIHPNSFVDLNLAGMAQYALGDVVAAESLFRQALQINPNSANTLHNIASVYLGLNRFAEAESLLLSAINLEPDNADILHGLAHIHANKKNYTKALDFLEKAQSITPSSERWKTAGSVHRRLGNHTEATHAYFSSYCLQGRNKFDRWDKGQIFLDANPDNCSKEDNFSRERLSLDGKPLGSELFTFEDVVVHVPTGMPITSTNKFFYKQFGFLSYPDKYQYLFTATGWEQVKEARAAKPDFDQAYISLQWNGYYHWLIDSVPHLYGLTKLNKEKEIPLLFTSFDDRRREAVKDMIQHLGVENAKPVLTNKEFVRLKRGYVNTRMSFPHVARILQLFSRGKDDIPKRSIYASRRSASYRRLINEAELIDLLTGRGFTVVDGEQTPFSEQVSLFASARCVVGPHGANLANIVFCSTNTPVLELFSGVIQPHYLHLSKALGLDFIQIQGRPSNPEDTMPGSNQDFRVDLGTVSATLDELGL